MKHVWTYAGESGTTLKWFKDGNSSHYALYNNSVSDQCVTHIVEWCVCLAQTALGLG